ncbi:hypothetical protein CCO03_03160 [Comamonas serinivorans]|uniref:Tetratricopeptide repeat protein n=1 Tax=Comamonas serinivorans TaxID=1082851 RepID=A0A1Y0EJK4_9BURK|nr:hypothetical protein [Comamonas serinivorans]ARU03815.1 hypothetical protein CCO03_03160 [Comamonas serinivorans]
MTTTNADVLRDDALDAFLDQVIAVARGDNLNPGDDDEHPELNEAQEIQARADACALLSSRTLAPADLSVLERLFRIWLWLEQPARAQAAIDAHEPALLSERPPGDHPDIVEMCALWRVEAAVQQADTPPAQLAALFEAAADGIGAASRQPDRPEHLTRHRWSGLMNDARLARQADIHERCARELHALHVQLPERQAWRTYDDAALQLSLALTAELRGEAAQAQQLALKAAQTLAHPAAGQDVDEDDWLRLAPDLVRLAPDTQALVDERARQALGPNPNPARLRDLSVRLARLQATSCWAQGNRAGALAAARRGRFLLTSDNDDAFTVTLMDWLMACDQEAEAARLALDACWNQREPSGAHAVTLAHRQLAIPSDHAGLWTLALAAAAFEGDLSPHDLQTLGHDDADQATRHLISHANALLPNHPALAVLEGRLLRREGQLAQALPKLERLLDIPDLANSDCALDLWYTRMQVLGSAQAMNQRFVEANSGNWSYALGVTLSDPDTVMDQLALTDAQREAFPSDALDALSTRYYERALMQFEAFFATGEGHVRDGDIHTYSMNCNNLAIAYRTGTDRTEEALALHRKGLAASPFAEHKLGAMWCLYKLDRHAEFVEAAEQLWHYAQDHGFGRHDPNSYFSNVAWALQHINRGHEIEIWLDRLRQWRTQQPDSELQENRPWLLGCEASMLDYLYRSKPDDALARMQAIRPELMACGRTWGLRRLGDGLLDAGQAQLALETYERAVAVFDPELDMEEARTHALSAIDKAREAVRKAKPFWRRWL